MSTDQNFNKDFDAKLTATMMAKYRASRTHCDWCERGQEEKLLVCSACEMAWYCSRKCQKKDWKRGGHKGHCQDFCDARDDLGPAAPVTMVAMKRLGNITLEEYESLIWDRLGFFAREMNRLATVRGKVVLHLDASANLFMEGGVYLVVAARIYGSERDVFCSLLPLKIDEGQVAEKHICQGSGRISQAAKKKVLKYLCRTVAILKEQKVFAMSITYGKGLSFMTSDKAFTNKIQEAGNGSIVFMPSMNF